MRDVGTGALSCEISPDAVQSWLYLETRYRAGISENLEQSQTLNLYIDESLKVPCFPHSMKNRRIEVRVPFEVQELIPIEFPSLHRPMISALSTIV